MRLKELRKAKNITQKELAKILGFEQTIVCMWELGTREPSNETLINMANYFNCSVDYLLGREDFEQEKKPEQVELNIYNEQLSYIKDFSKQKINCLNMLAEMNEEQTKLIQSYMQGILGKEFDYFTQN